jgi:drug/metabolite transporter (DMT)-like permease
VADPRLAVERLSHRAPAPPDDDATGPWPRQAALRWALVAGRCDMTANALYLLATRGGDLSVVAPIAALYPVTTVILALIIEHERLRGIQ